MLLWRNSQSFLSLVFYIRPVCSRSLSPCSEIWWHFLGLFSHGQLIGFLNLESHGFPLWKSFNCFLESVPSFFFFSYNCHYSGNRPHLNPFILYFFPFCLLSSESFLQLFPNPSIEFFVSVSLVKCLKKNFFLLWSQQVPSSWSLSRFSSSCITPVSSMFSSVFGSLSLLLEQGSPAPGPWTGTSPWPDRSRATH